MCDQTFKNILCEAKHPMLTVRLWRLVGPCPGLLVSEKPWYPAVWRMISLFSFWICRFLLKNCTYFEELCERALWHSYFVIFLKQYVILPNSSVPNYWDLSLWEYKTTTFWPFWEYWRINFALFTSFLTMRFIFFGIYHTFFTKGNESEIAFIDALTTDASSTLLRAGS